jgi:phosphoribosylaminoimidazole-succinocarboxamide synthase
MTSSSEVSKISRPAPALPGDIVAKTQRKYLDAYRLLTGRELDLG